MATVSVSEAAAVGRPSSVSASCGIFRHGSYLVSLVCDRRNCCGCLAGSLGNQRVSAISIPLPKVRGVLLHAKDRTDQSRKRLVDQVLSLRGTRPVLKNVQLSLSSKTSPSPFSPLPPSQNPPRSPTGSSAERFVASCQARNRPRTAETRAAVPVDGRIAKLTMITPKQSTPHQKVAPAISFRYREGYGAANLSDGLHCCSLQGIVRSA
jgi:hypothetical protein